MMFYVTVYTYNYVTGVYSSRSHLYPDWETAITYCKNAVKYENAEVYIQNEKGEILHEER